MRLSSKQWPICINRQRIWDWVNWIAGWKSNWKIIRRRRNKLRKFVLMQVKFWFSALFTKVKRDPSLVIYTIKDGSLLAISQGCFSFFVLYIVYSGFYVYTYLQKHFLKMSDLLWTYLQTDKPHKLPFFIQTISGNIEIGNIIQEYYSHLWYTKYQMIRKGGQILWNKRLER